MLDNSYDQRLMAAICEIERGGFDLEQRTVNTKLATLSQEARIIQCSGMINGESFIAALGNIEYKKSL